MYILYNVMYVSNNKCQLEYYAEIYRICASTGTLQAHCKRMRTYF